MATPITGLGDLGNLLLGGQPSTVNLPASPTTTKVSVAPGVNTTTPQTTTTQTTATAPAQTSSSTYEDKTNDIAVQNAGLANVGATQTAGTNAVNDALSKLMGTYNTEGNDAQTSYTGESNDNQTDLQSNKETALQDAVQGRKGLYGTLASLGALSGSGLTLANNAVQKGANEDLTTAGDTYATNQNALDTSYGNFNTSNTERKQTAQAAAANDIEQVQNDAAKNQQQYLSNLVTDYAAEGNAPAAAAAAAKVAALYPTVAATNVPTIDLGYSGSAYTAPTLASYLGQANNTTVQTVPATTTNSALNVPGLIATNKKTASA